MTGLLLFLLVHSGPALGCECDHNGGHSWLRLGVGYEMGNGSIDSWRGTTGVGFAIGRGRITLGAEGGVIGVSRHQITEYGDDYLSRASGTYGDLTIQVRDLIPGAWRVTFGAAAGPEFYRAEIGLRPGQFRSEVLWQTEYGGFLQAGPTSSPIDFRFDGAFHKGLRPEFVLSAVVPLWRRR